MPSLIDRLAARLAAAHARRVSARFRQSLRNLRASQQAALRRALAAVRSSDLARCHGLARVRTGDDLRKAMPLLAYEDIRPYVERVAAGDTSALFAPGQRVLMFARSSGTTAKPKLIPVTPQFVDSYRRGWNIFGLKMLLDHPAAILRPILQSSGRHDESHTAAGIPCGAITGLLAQTQKRIVRRYYVGTPEIARLADAPARYYTLMRLGAVRDVAFAITANPATLIRMAQVADQRAESLIRDIRDGTLSREIVTDQSFGGLLAARLKPNRQRAAELEQLYRRHGRLRPSDYWKLEFLACWTGGSLGHYRDRLADWYGPLPVRDIGLLASEGRVSLPLEDGDPAGVLDADGAFFEFIPLQNVVERQPETLTPAELEVGRDYAVVLSNETGLLRYRLDDVVRVRGFLESTPLVEFLYRAGRVASIAGEKLTENQVTAAVGVVCRRLGISEFDFLLGPCWGDPPYYRLSCPAPHPPGLAQAFDRALREQNEEYDSRRKSTRLADLCIRTIPADAIPAMDKRILAARGASAEQYKRQCLLTEPDTDDKSLGFSPARRGSEGRESENTKKPKKAI